MTLDQISDRTKISLRHLEAIEAEDFEKLPGGFFARSFVKQYARALELDEHELESELERLSESPPSPSAPVPEFVPHEVDVAPITSELRGGLGERFSLGSVLGFVLVVLACSGIYTLWQRHRTPEPVRETVSAPKEAPAAEVRPAAQTQSTPAVTPPEPAKVPGGSATAEQPAAVAAPAAPAAPATAAAPPPNARIQLQLGATADTWVRVTSDQKIVYAGTLKPGQPKTFYGESSMAVRTGNAGGLQVDWNGKPLGPVGPIGQIRELEFTPEGHKIVAPPPKPAAPPDIF